MSSNLPGRGEEQGNNSEKGTQDEKNEVKLLSEEGQAFLREHRAEIRASGNWSMVELPPIKKGTVYEVRLSSFNDFEGNTITTQVMFADKGYKNNLVATFDIKTTANRIEVTDPDTTIIIIKESSTGEVNGVESNEPSFEIRTTNPTQVEKILYETVHE